MSTLTLVASLISVVSVVIYCMNVARGGAIPNATTWILRSFVGTINLVSYMVVIQENYLRALPLVIVTLGIYWVTLYSFAKGRFARVNRLDASCFALAVAAAIYWSVTGNPQLANLLLQVVYVLAFIPTLAALHSRRIHESAAPWVLAMIACLIMMYEVAADGQSASWIALVHPFVKAVSNGAIAFYALRHLRSTGIDSPLSRETWRNFICCTEHAA